VMIFNVVKDHHNFPSWVLPDHPEEKSEEGSRVTFCSCFRTYLSSFGFYAPKERFAFSLFLLLWYLRLFSPDSPFIGNGCGVRQARFVLKDDYAPGFPFELEFFFASAIFSSRSPASG
jgi:hypothetical protein